MSGLFVRLPIVVDAANHNNCSLECQGITEPYEQHLCCKFFDEELTATIDENKPREYRGKYVTDRVPDVARCAKCLASAEVAG